MTNPGRDLDPLTESLALSRSFLGVKIGVSVFSGIIILGAILLAIRNGPDTSSSPPRLTILDEVAVLRIPLLTLAYLFAFSPGATSMRLTDQGDEFAIPHRRPWKYGWSRADLNIVLDDCREGPRGAADPFSPNVRFAGFGRCTLLSAPAFDELVRCARAHGLKVTESMEGMGAQDARRALIIQQPEVRPAS